MLSQVKIQALAGALSVDVRSAETAWPGYKPSDFPIYFLELSQFAGCEVLWEHGKLTAKPRDTDLQSPSNGIYTFCGGTYPACPNASGKEPKLAMIYRVDNALDRLASVGFSPPKIDFEMIAHEGFHVFGQSLLNPAKSWPVLQEHDVSLSNRQMIVDNCYNSSSAIKGMAEDEIAVLQSTLHLSDSSGDAAQVKRLVRTFFSKRKARYDALNAAGITDGQGNSCEYAEAMMELIEGSADFVGLFSTMNAAVMSSAEVESYIDLAIRTASSGELYYHFGSVALLIVRRTDPAGFTKFVSLIDQATHPEQTIMFEFSKWAVGQ